MHAFGFGSDSLIHLPYSRRRRARSPSFLCSSSDAHVMQYTTRIKQNKWRILVLANPSRAGRHQIGRPAKGGRGAQRFAANRDPRRRHKYELESVYFGLAIVLSCACILALGRQRQYVRPLIVSWTNGKVVGQAPHQQQRQHQRQRQRQQRQQLDVGEQQAASNNQ